MASTAATTPTAMNEDDKAKDADADAHKEWLVIPAHVRAVVDESRGGLVWDGTRTAAARVVGSDAAGAVMRGMMGTPTRFAVFVSCGVVGGGCCCSRGSQ